MKSAKETAKHSMNIIYSFHLLWEAPPLHVAVLPSKQYKAEAILLHLLPIHWRFFSHHAFTDPLEYDVKFIQDMPAKELGPNVSFNPFTSFQTVWI